MHTIFSLIFKPYLDGEKKTMRHFRLNNVLLKHNMETYFCCLCFFNTYVQSDLSYALVFIYVAF